MNFPGNILNGISRFFDGDGDGDEILIYVLVFLFIFLTSRQDERASEDERTSEGAIPFVLIAIFVLFFLSNNQERDLIL